jgi:hypothetical protein
LQAEKQVHYQRRQYLLLKKQLFQLKNQLKLQRKQFPNLKKVKNLLRAFKNQEKVH